MRPKKIGLSWYERDDYPRILQVMEDAHTLPRTYDEFVKGYERLKSQAEAVGLEVVSAVIKPDEFQTWCRKRKLKVDTEARRRFGAEIAAHHVIIGEKKSRNAGLH